MRQGWSCAVNFNLVKVAAGITKCLLFLILGCLQFNLIESGTLVREGNHNNLLGNHNNLVGSHNNLVGCAEPEDILNGNVTTSNGTATYTCDLGYYISDGNENRTCEGGSWDGPLPNCTIIDCNEPDNISNGNVTTSGGTTYGHVATYMCNAGYYMRDKNANLTCKDGGIWIGSKPTCEVNGGLKGCGQPVSPDNGMVRVRAGATGGKTAIFSCNKGYVLQGVSSAKCQQDGIWGGQTPACVLKGGLIALNNVLTLNITRSAVVEMARAASYSEVQRVLLHFYGTELKHDLVDISINNIANGNLTVNYTIIIRQTEQSAQVFAQSSSNLAQGIVLEIFHYPVWTMHLMIEDTLGMSHTIGVGTNNIEDTTCAVFLLAFGPCHKGYACAVIGVPACRPDPSTDCGVPASPTNGFVDFSQRTFYGNVATYFCNIGYTLVGSETRTCQANASWSSTVPACRITDCGVLYSPTNGTVLMTSGTSHGREAVFTCAPGFSMIGISVVTCQADGTWSAHTPMCSQTACGGLSSPLYGNVVVSGDGLMAVYTCQTGYVLMGNSDNNVRTCMSSNQWSGSMPYCKIRDCLPLSNPINGKVDISSGTTYRKIAKYYCTTPGYALSGPASRTCGADGFWSKHAPKCVRNGHCSRLHHPVNGGVNHSSGMMPGAVVTYWCFAGYVLIGYKIRVCTTNNTWSGGAPLCRNVDCKSLPNPVNGVITSNGTTYGSLARYHCQPGYELLGVANRSCLDTGSWSSAMPACILQDCEPLKAPLFGDILLYRLNNLSTERSSAMYICDEGYTLQGPSTRTCNSSLMWSNHTPFCELTDCGTLSSPANGLVLMQQGTKYARKASYICNTGYILMGVSTRVCQANGTWSHVEPVCSSSVDLAIAVGLSLGLTGLVILIVTILALAYVYRDKHSEDLELKRTRLLQAVAEASPAPPLPLKTNTSVSLPGPHHGTNDFEDEGSEASYIILDTWKSRNKEF